MNYCPNCGTAVAAEQKFCGKCGTSIVIQIQKGRPSLLESLGRFPTFFRKHIIKKNSVFIVLLILPILLVINTLDLFRSMDNFLMFFLIGIWPEVLFITFISMQRKSFNEGWFISIYYMLIAWILTSSAFQLDLESIGTIGITNYKFTYIAAFATIGIASVLGYFIITKWNDISAQIRFRQAVFVIVSIHMLISILKWFGGSESQPDLSSLPNNLDNEIMSLIRNAEYWFIVLYVFSLVFSRASEIEKS